MYDTNLSNLLSQSWSHFVILLASTQTARKRSGRANLAPYMIFMRTLAATTRYWRSLFLLVSEADESSSFRGTSSESPVRFA